MKKFRQFLFAVVASATVALHAQSNKPFSASATTTTGNVFTISASGSNFGDFVSSIINTSGSFDLLSNRAYNATATFLGVKDAITFSTNAQGTAVTMALRPINFTRTFTGASDSEVEDQISDFFEKNGVDTVARFLKAIAEQSTVAVTDGNPNSATAISAGSTFASQGFTPADEIGNVTAGATSEESSSGTPSKPKFGGFGIGFNAGRFEAAGFKGETIDVSTTGLSIGFGERVRLLTPLSANYLKVEGAQVGGVGVGLALPIRFKVMSKDNAWNWRVTPTGGVSARASIDLAGGALLWHAGVINSIDYRVNPKVVLCLVNQFTAHKSIKLEYGDYSFDPKVDQQIVKTGLRMVNPLTRRLILDVFVVDTRFLKAAAVDQFYSAGGSLSLRVSQRFNLTLGANYDTGDNYKSYSGGLSSSWKW